MPTLPDKPTIRYAADRAATWRRTRYRDDDRYRHFSDNAMLEQVCGVEGSLFDLGAGWWRVGIVMDVIAGVQLDVLVNPGEQRIRLRAPPPPPVKKPPRTTAPARTPIARSVPDERGRNPLKWDEW